MNLRRSLSILSRKTRTARRAVRGALGERALPYARFRLIPALRFFFILNTSLFTLSVFSAENGKNGGDIFANTPVKNFSLPYFNDDTGYREYLARGDKATYISTTQIDIVGLNFTQFPGDGSTIAKARLTAPTATLYAKDKQAPVLSGKESVHLIYGDDLDATGEDWSYDHGQKKIIINRDARIVYKNAADTLHISLPKNPSLNSSGDTDTIITSTALTLTQHPDGTTFAVFTGDVVATTSEDIRLTCDHLEVTATHLQDKDPALTPLDKFQLLVATGSVRLTQNARTMTCGRAEVHPRDDRIILTQNATVADDTLRMTATGDPLILHRSDRRIEGKRVYMTLPPLEDKEQKPGDAKAADTIITANNCVIWQTPDNLTHATLDNTVNVIATDLILSCEHLELTADTQQAKVAGTTEAKIATVQRLLATRDVHLVQGAREATCGQAEVLPRDDRIILTQNPVLHDHAASARATGDIFTLRRIDRRVTGENVHITLPPLEDLSATAGKTSAPPSQTQTRSTPQKGTSPTGSPNIPTTVTSSAFAMWQPAGDPLVHATFDSNVHVAATNLTLVCDHLMLTADPVKPGTPQTASAAPRTPEDIVMAQLRYLRATDHVHFTQLTREAYCERAELFPREDRITLTGKPVITDSARNITATGDTLTLIRGQQDIQGENVRITAPLPQAP